MKVEVEDISKVEKRLNIEIPPEQVDDEIEDQYKDFMTKAQVPGFRPGKAPRKIIERRFGKYVNEVAAQKIVERTLKNALENKSIDPVVEPVLDPAELKPGEAYKYTVHVEVKPVVELGDYKGLEVKHADEKVSDEDVNKALEAMRENVAPISEPETPRPVKKDDQVTAVVKARANGEDVEFGKEPEQVVELWHESWIPGLADQLAGKSIGDTAAFEVEVPDNENSPAAYRGKKLELSFEIKTIKERLLPEINDDFAKEYTRFDTLAELKDSVKKSLEERTDSQNRDRLQNAVIDVLVEKNPLDVPPSLAGREALQMAREFMYRNFRRQATDQEADRFKEMFMGDAKRLYQVNYLLEAIADAEKLEATEEEIEKQIEKDAAAMNLHPDKLKSRMGEGGDVAMKHRVRLEKALDFLVSVANIKQEADAEAKKE